MLAKVLREARRTLRPTLLIAIVAIVLGSGAVATVGAQDLSDGGDAKARLAEVLRLRSSDGDTTLRYIVVTVAALLISFGVFIGHRKYRESVGRRPARVRWDESLGRRGLDTRESQLLTEVAERLGMPSAVDLIHTRHGFERAIETYGSGGVADDEQFREIAASIRQKLGWDTEVAVAPKSEDELLETNLILELFGMGASAGYCVRAVLVHRDAEQLILKLDDEVRDIPWQMGETVQGYFWRENDAGYYFQCEIQEIRSDRFTYLVCTRPHDLERKQKRMFVRARHRTPVKYMVIPRGEAASRVGCFTLGETLEREGMTEDVSAGGFRFVTDEELNFGDYVSIRSFSPGDGEEILATVVNDLGTTDSGQRRYGVKYSGITVPLRDTITRFVFEVQRRELAKRRGDREAGGVTGDEVGAGKPTPE